MEPHKSQDAHAIADSFFHSELNGINKIFKQYTGQCSKVVT